MNAEALLQLAAWAEAATGGRGGLDDLSRLIHDQLPDGVRPVNGAVRDYCGSIDAAISLMPENHIHAIFYLEDGIKVQMWDRTRGDYCGFGVDVPEATAATYALALTAAALKARAGVKS